MNALSHRILLCASLGLFCLLCLAPVVSLFSTLLSQPTELSIWARLLQSKAVSLTLQSALMALIAVLTASLIAIPLGLSLASGGRHLTMGDLAFFLPLTIPPYLTAACWQSILGRNGFLPSLISHVPGWEMGYDWLSGPLGSGLVLGFAYFPILLYLVISGLYSIGSVLEDAAKLMLPEKRILLSVTLPLLLPHLLTGALLVFLLALTNYSVPALLGFKTITIKIYAHFSIFQNVSGAVLLSIPLVLLSVFVVSGLHHLTRNKSFFTPHAERFGAGNLSMLRSRAFTAAARFPAACIISAPLVFLIITAGSLETLLEGLRQSSSSMGHSFILAISGSLGITCLAFFIGYASERMKILNNWIGKAVLFLPFALPSVLGAIGLIQIWNRPGLDVIYRSLLILVLLWAAKYLPLAQRIIADQLRHVPDSLEEAATMVHTPWFRTMHRIVWPLTRPGFLLAWCILYIFSLAELGGMLLIIPPGADMMPIRLYNVMHYGSTGLMAAQGLIIVCMALGPLLVLALLRQVSTGRRHTP